MLVEFKIGHFSELSLQYAVVKGNSHIFSNTSNIRIFIL